MSTRRKPQTEEITENVEIDLQAYGKGLINEALAEVREETYWPAGTSGNSNGRPVQPDNLTDMLLYRLGKKGMREICDALISLAKRDGDGISAAVQLQSIREVFDRIEGKARQTNIEARAHDDPLLDILREMNATPAIDQKPQASRISASAGKLLEAPIREASSEEDWP